MVNLFKQVFGFAIIRILTTHIYYNNLITGENSYSKLTLVDLAGSEGSIAEDESGERVTELLHVMKSLSAYVIFTKIVLFHYQYLPFFFFMLIRLWGCSFYFIIFLFFSPHSFSLTIEWFSSFIKIKA